MVEEKWKHVFPVEPAELELTKSTGPSFTRQAVQADR